MHSSLVRAQNVFGFFTTVAFCVGALIAASVLISPRSPTASIEVRNVQVVKGRPHYYSTKKEEYAHIRFDLDADFSSLFDWNTKQLFVYVLASYPPSSSSSSSQAYQQLLSQSIIWDTIIPSSALSQPSPFSFSFSKSPSTKRTSSTKSKVGKEKDENKKGVVRLRNQKPKYQISDPSGHLAERGNVTLEIGWNVQPWVGALTWTQWANPGLGRWRWKSLMGGRSQGFEFPPLKGGAKKKVGAEGDVGGSGSGGTPKAGEASPIV